MSWLVRFIPPAERAPARLVSAARVALAVFAVCVTALACSASGSSSAPSTGGIGGDAGAAGANDVDTEPMPDHLFFAPTTLLKLSPKQSHQLTVTSQPRGSYRVTFALLDSGSASTPGDAVLSATDVQTTADGVAHVTLTASSIPTTFTVRASVGGKAQTQIGVAVSSLGYTTLRVLPSYSGHRSVAVWTATARTGTKCSKLTGNPPPDGDLSTSAAAREALNIAQVPIGVDLTVTLRAGHYIGGCVDQPALSEGDGNQVLVYASDRAVNLDATQLVLSFGPSDSRPAFSKLMKSSASAAESALLGSATSDVQALLDAMHDATSAANRDSFSATRTAQNWDSVLAATFGPNSATRLRDPADRWLTAGLANLNAPDAFVGQLTAQGDGALFALSSVVHVAPSDAGLPSSFNSSWSADPSDTLLFGTELSWVPSRLVTALAIAPALLEFPEQANLEAALAQSVDCSLVAKTLLAHGSAPGTLAYGTCDSACALATCASAISALWQKASDSSGTDIARLGVTATGNAQVGDEAEITSVKGTWLGELNVGSDSAAISGVLSAVSFSN